MVRSGLSGPAGRDYPGRMKKLSFWHGEFAQVDAINEAAGEIDLLHWNNQALREHVASLRQITSEQRVEIRQLQAALQAVCDLLVDLDLIEEQALAYRVDTAMTEATRPPEPAAPQPAAPLPDVVCAGCQRRVSAREISYTDTGPMCDACSADVR